MTVRRKRVIRYPAPLNRPAAPSELEKGNRNHLLERFLQGGALQKKSRERRKRRFRYELDGLKLLCEHYAIPWGWDAEPRFFLLSVCLARDHVPYFRERATPKSHYWTIQRQVQLLRDVERARHEVQGRRPPGKLRRGSVRYGISWLIHNETRYAKGYEEASLEARYKEAARNSVAAILARYSKFSDYLQERSEADPVSRGPDGEG